jgi:hypothetical protein
MNYKTEKILSKLLIKEGFRDKKIVIRSYSYQGEGFYSVEFIEVDENGKIIGVEMWRYLDTID